MKTIRKILVLISAGLFVNWFSIHAQTWTPPIGVPIPEFGIFETYRMYDDPDKRNPNLMYTQNDEGGFFTHYIDNTDEHATDDENAYGTAQRPRLTIPIELAEGAVVELHGGPYVYEVGSAHYIIVKSSGTASHPVFIRSALSAQKVVFQTSRIKLSGSYLVFENIFLRGGGLYGGMSIAAPSDHMVMRNCEVTSFIGSPSNIIALAPSGNDSIDFNEWIVLYNNYFHDNGYPCDSSVNLHNAIQISGNSRQIWILDNIISGTAEDAIHIIYYHDAKYLPDGIYIGRNRIDHNSENAIDVKPSRNVVISQNTIFGYTAMNFPPNDGSDGSAVCFNYENGAPAGQVIENHYLIYNNIYDANVGFRAEYSGYVYGNILYNLNSSAIWINGNALNYMYVVNNSIYNAPYGIYHSRGALFYAYNNLIVNPSLGHLKYQTNGDREIRNNMFYHLDGLFHLWIGGSGAQETVGLANVSASTNISNCYEGSSDLLSIDPTNEKFLKSEASGRCVNTGESSGRVQEVIDHYYEDFGLDIAYDFCGVSRPQDSAWDIGAYENQGSNTVIKSQNQLIQFRLHQNYPNPFNPSTVISYKLKVKSEVVLKIYDILGREIAVLVNEVKNAGDYSIEWDGTSSAGQKVGSGIYFYQLRTSSGFTSTKKMILLK